MKRIAATLAFIVLAGCTGLTNDMTTIQKIQILAVNACKFIPTAETVGQIILANNPALTTASAIAQAICAAVTASAAAPTVAGPMVAGVPIRGGFAR